MKHRPTKEAPAQQEKTKTYTINITPLWAGVCWTVARAAAEGNSDMEKELLTMARLADFGNLAAPLVRDPEISQLIDKKHPKKFKEAIDLFDAIIESRKPKPCPAIEIALEVAKKAGPFPQKQRGRKPKQ